MADDEVAHLRHDNLEDVAHLASSERYGSIMGAVRAALREDDDAQAGAAAAPAAWAGPADEDPTYT
jgi:hypothetical protein